LISGTTLTDPFIYPDISFKKHANLIPSYFQSKDQAKFYKKFKIRDPLLPVETLITLQITVQCGYYFIFLLQISEISD